MSFWALRKLLLPYRLERYDEYHYIFIIVEGWSLSHHWNHALELHWILCNRLDGINLDMVFVRCEFLPGNAIRRQSCATWDVQNPVNDGVFTISTGAGFQPSTVGPRANTYCMLDCNGLHGPKRGEHASAEVRNQTPCCIGVNFHWLKRPSAIFENLHWPLLVGFSCWDFHLRTARQCKTNLLSITNININVDINIETNQHVSSSISLRQFHKSNWANPWNLAVVSAVK